jgi:hypothetical protein
MIDTRVVSQEIQDRILGQVRRSQEQVRKGQEQLAEAVRSWTATAQSIAPQLPAMQAWTAKLPKPEELVANAQDFALQLLAAQRKTSEQLFAVQRKFAEEAMEAVKPLLALASAAPVRPGDKPSGAVKTAGTAKPARAAAKKPGAVKK